MDLEIVSPLSDPRVDEVLDSAYQRSGRESQLARRLASDHPSFDAGLSLLACESGRALGYALFLPRDMELRGATVRLAVVAPFGVVPTTQRRGVGRFLLRTALGALRDRGLRGAAVIGASEFFAAFGFEPAFDACSVRVPVDILPAEGDTSSWRGLAERDLARLGELQQRSYAGIDGSERRRAAAIEWESAVPHAHTLVSERAGEIEAFVRFRVRHEIELSECGAIDARARASVLRLLRRLAREHQRARVEAHLPHAHALARELFHAGAVRESHAMSGAARLCIVDWPGFFADTQASWRASMSAAGVTSISLEIDGANWRLEDGPQGLRVGTERDTRHHLRIPAGWAAGLITGQRDWRDLESERDAAFEPSTARVARALFPGGCAFWTYAPVFELVDE